MTLIEAFDLGYDWAADLQNPQALEDSRAVGRTLLSERFNKLKLNLDEFNSFQSADLGICSAKKIIHDGLSSLEKSNEEATTESIALEEIALSVVVHRIDSLEADLAYWKERAEERIGLYHEMYSRYLESKAEENRLIEMLHISRNK